VALWDVRTGGRGTTLSSPSEGFRGGIGTVTAVRFSPDGRALVVAAGSVQMWDVSRSGQPRLATTVDRGVDAPQVPQPQPVRDAVFDERASLLATTGGTTRLWDVGWLLSPGHLTTQRLAAVPSAVALSRDADTIAFGLRDGSVHSYSLGGRTGRARKPVPVSGSESRAVGLVAFRPGDGGLLVGRHRTTELWRLGAGRAHLETSHVPAGETALQYTPASDILLTSDTKGRVRLWDLSDGANPQRLPGLESETPADVEQPTALSADGTRLLLQGHSEPSLHGIGKPEGARVLDPPEADWTASTYAHYAPWSRVALSSDGGVLAAARGGTLTTYPLNEPDQQGTQTTLPADITAMAFNEQGTLLVTGDDSGHVRLWSADALGRLRALTDLVGTGPVSALAFGRQDTLAVGFGDATVTVSRLAPEFLMSRLCAVRPPDSLGASWSRYAKGVRQEDACPAAAPAP
jgi:WD40 repeat protein